MIFSITKLNSLNYDYEIFFYCSSEVSILILENKVAIASVMINRKTSIIHINNLPDNVLINFFPYLIYKGFIKFLLEYGL